MPGDEANRGETTVQRGTCKVSAQLWLECQARVSGQCSLWGRGVHKEPRGEERALPT
jgi:hypothetical protein